MPFDKTLGVTWMILRSVTVYIHREEKNNAVCFPGNAEVMMISAFTVFAVKHWCLQ